MARDEGWLAEHMLILKVTSPEGEARVHRRRVPQRLRQDQPGDGDPDPPDWKVETIGDDIAWMKFGEDGQLYAVTRRPASSASAPGTGARTNPNAIDMVGRNAVFTNCARTATTVTSGGRA